MIYVRIGNTLLSTLMVKSCLIPDPHLHIIVNRVLNSNMALRMLRCHRITGASQELSSRLGVSHLIFCKKVKALLILQRIIGYNNDKRLLNYFFIHFSIQTSRPQVLVICRRENWSEEALKTPCP